MISESFLLKRAIPKNIFTVAALNQIPVTQSFAYGIYCIREVKMWLKCFSKLITDGFLSDTLRYKSPDLYCQRGLPLGSVGPHQPGWVYAPHHL
ncbi:MAG: hypothetical protein BGO55_01690 [Sphingobacteriales bacterium 50-39]|nr:MAG: hypothetical protein BGO55_01690 [Sphingobacteriales bacterium 50-39]